MIQLYRYDDLGVADYGWLQTRYHFSFNRYYNSERMGFGLLRVINDDRIKAGTGFDTHPHQNMEIITYVRQGALTHRDSQGNEGRTEAGDVQVMSAGSGIAHSEYNRESVDTVLYQIWIQPNQQDVEPRWEQKPFPHQPVKDALTLLVTGRDDPNALRIHQDADIYGGRLEANTTIQHAIRHQAYVLVSEGVIRVDGTELHAGDGAEITELKQVTVSAISAAEMLILDVPRR